MNSAATIELAAARMTAVCSQKPVRRRQGFGGPAEASRRRNERRRVTSQSRIAILYGAKEKKDD